MNNSRNEVSFYPEIQKFIEAQLKSNFSAMHHRELEVYWGIGEMKSNLLRILKNNPNKCACAKNFILQTPPLSVDIFALITDGNKFQILILEVKLMNSVGLKEWSQLVGYCLVSGAKYGLLLNVNNGASPRLSEILSTKAYISNIRNVIDNEVNEHCLGFMQWDSLTQSFEYTNLGFIKSLSELSDRIAIDFA